jgi:hypothetical protein
MLPPRALPQVLHLRQGGKDMPAKVNSSLHKVLAALGGVASLEDLRLECDLSNVRTRRTVAAGAGCAGAD